MSALLHTANATPDMAATSVVAMSDVRFTWPGKPPFSLAIDAFALERGARMLLLGSSGSGKSTFLSLLCGTVAPDAGEITILGTPVGSLSGGARDRFRAEHFGIIFQMFNLLPYGTVIDNVMLPLHFATGRRDKAVANGGTAADEAARLLARLGLEDEIIKGQSAAHLSVGQQQRVAAARALIGRPELIVADEPTSSLDRDRQAAFLDLLFAEADAAGASLIMVSHDESLAPHFTSVRRLSDFAKVSRGAN